MERFDRSAWWHYYFDKIRKLMLRIEVIEYLNDSFKKKKKEYLNDNKLLNRKKKEDKLSKF